MNKRVLIIFSVMALVLAVVVFAMGQHEGHGKPAAKEVPKAAKEKKPTAQLETQPAQPEAMPPTVEISPEKQQLIGVKTVTVSVQPIQKTIRATGRIEYDEKKLATINVKFEGWIEKLYVDYTGRYVKKGEPLAAIYSPELLATQQEYLNVLKLTKRQTGDKGKGDIVGQMIAKDSGALLEAARQRLKLWDISEKQIEKLEETGKPTRTLTLYSPVSGYVVQKNAIQGMRVMPGEKLFDLADLSTVWITADIYEFDIPFVREGTTAKIAISNIPGKTFNAKINYVYPTLSPETRTAKVRFVMPNPGNRLKPQMFTEIEVMVNMGNKLAIPEDAVIETGTRSIVYVDRGEGNFEPREVKLGNRGGKFVEILSGLKKGERVASSANFLIDSEAQLKGVAPVPPSATGAKGAGSKTAPAPAHKH